MKTKKKKLFPVIAILLLLGTAAVCFFQFTSFGYLMTVPCRSEKSIHKALPIIYALLRQYSQEGVHLSAWFKEANWKMCQNS